MTITRDCLLIGNGPSALDARLGEAVDRFDGDVIRFNQFRIAGFEHCIGSRTNVWITTLPYPGHVGHLCRVIYHSWDHDHQPGSRPAGLERASAFDRSSVAEARKISGYEAPSTGIIAMCWAAKTYRRVYFMGFDAMNESRPHHYGDTSQRGDIHKPACEQMALRTLRRRGEVIPFGRSISIVIANKDEGPQLEQTVASCLAAEPPPQQVIVCDDHSAERVDARLGSTMKRWPALEVVKTPQPVGCCRTRRYGASFAHGDVLVFLDSHMQLPVRAFDLIDRAVAEHPNAVMCATCIDFDGRFVGAGAEFIEANDTLFTKYRWRGQKAVGTDFTQPIPMLLGACYIVPRHIWEALDGFHPQFYGWGMDEEDLSLRAILLGFDVRNINGLHVPHHFGRTWPRDPALKLRRLNAWHRHYNAMTLAATIFEDGVFETIYEPFFRRRLSRSAIARFDAHRRQIMEFRAKMQRRRVLSDDELQARSGYTIPTLEHQRRVMGETPAKLKPSSKPESGPILPCRHRGKPLRITNCHQCGPGARIGVLQCSVHGECIVPDRQVEGLPSCATCEDRSPAAQLVYAQSDG